jgi:hypothetical protein
MAILAVGTPQSTSNVSGPAVIIGNIPNEIQPGLALRLSRRITQTFMQISICFREMV